MISRPTAPDCFTKGTNFQTFREAYLARKFYNPPDAAVSFADVNLDQRYNRSNTRKEFDPSTELVVNHETGKVIQLGLPIMGANWLELGERASTLMALNGVVPNPSRDHSIETQAKIIEAVKGYIKAPPLIEKFSTKNPIIELRDGIQFTVQQAVNAMRKHRVNHLFFKLNGEIYFTSLTHLFLSLRINSSQRSTLQTDIRNRMIKVDTSAIINEDEVSGHTQISKIAIDTGNPVFLTTVDGNITGYTANEFWANFGSRKMATDNQGKLAVGGTIGLGENNLERAQTLIDAGVDYLLIDVAHGYTHRMKHCIRALRDRFGSILIIGGNVANAKAAEMLLREGAGVKVGVGPGKACQTRMITGVGMPQVSAILEAAIAKAFLQTEDGGSHDLAHLPIISDGGISGHTGNMIKAIAAGADLVFRGSFGSCNEANTQRLEIGRTVMAEYAGNGSEIHRARLQFARENGITFDDNGNWETLSFDRILDADFERKASVLDPWTDYKADEGTTVLRKPNTTAAVCHNMHKEIITAFGYNGISGITSVDELKKEGKFWVVSGNGADEGRTRR